MLFRAMMAAVAAMLFCTPSLAHGGGAHGGGHVVFVGGYGAVAAPPPPAPEIGNYSSIHTVAVLSAVGQSLLFRTPGGVLFSQKKVVDISNWGLDDFVAGDVGRLLSERFKLKTVAYNRAALASIPGGDHETATKALTAYLGGIDNQGIDAFVIIRPDDEGAYAQLPGLELLTAANGFLPTEWLGFEIEIVDAHSLARIAKCFARIQTRAGTPANFAGFLPRANRNLDSTLIATDAQMALYRSDFRHDLAVTLGSTLAALQLGLSIPGPGDEPLVPTATPRFANIRSIAVVSALGDTFMFGYRTVLFQHHVATTPISDWNLDSQIESMVSAALDKRYTVKNVSVDRAALARTIATSPNGSFSGTTIAGPIAGLPASADVDAYLIVVKRSAPMADATDPMSGVGIWKRKPFGGELTALFANYEIALVDAHTLAPIIRFTGTTSHHWPSPFVFRKVADSIWPSGDVDALAPDQVGAVQATLHDMLSDSIDETLLEMGLTGMRRDLEYGAGTPPAEPNEDGMAATGSLP